tara:strand:- start:4724 stop:5452 length:729 start_codon:yes stop_codon:yes gene_type:complete
MKIVLTALALLFGSISFAQDRSKAVRVNLGVFYSQRSIYRGALIWDGAILAAGPSFILYDRISVGAGGLSAFKRFGEFHTVTIGFSYFDDNEPSGPVLKLSNSVEDYKNQRSATFGSYLKYDYRNEQYIAFSSELHKDLKRHKGLYSYNKLSTSILPFLTLGIAYGIGDSNNNKYVYGPEGTSGGAHFDYLASVMLPILPWQGRLIMSYTYITITKSENIAADYIRGLESNEQISLGAMWSF